MNPPLQDWQLLKLLARINGGELGLLEKTETFFVLTPEQRRLILTVIKNQNDIPKTKADQD
jgi:hypothetical protein